MNKKNLEEVSSCNIFLLKVLLNSKFWTLFLMCLLFMLHSFAHCLSLKSFQGNIISTPATSGTILAGITRKSIIEIASDYGFQVLTSLVSFIIWNHTLNDMLYNFLVYNFTQMVISSSDNRTGFGTHCSFTHQELYFMDSPRILSLVHAF